MEEPNQEQALEILKGFTSLLKVPKARKVIERNLDGEESKSVKSYYTEKEAKELIPIIDAMMVDKEDREFRFEDFSAYWKPNTVWIKLNQALKYLVDHLDTEDHKYRSFRDQIQVRRTKNGVLFHWVSDASYTNRSWVAHKINPNILAEYKQKVYSFMENSKPGEYLHLENLSLSPHEIEDLNTLLEGNEVFISKISAHEIKIVHVNQSSDI